MANREISRNTSVGRQVAADFEAQHSDDAGDGPFVVEARRDGWYVVLGDGSGREARARLATSADLSDDPYDACLFRFETLPAAGASAEETVARTAFPGGSAYVQPESFALVGSVAMIVCTGGTVVYLMPADVVRFAGTTLPPDWMIVKRETLDALVAGREWEDPPT